MKKGWMWTGVATVVLAAGVGIGTVYYYGSDDTLPDGVTVGGLSVGKQSPEDAIGQLKARIAELEGTKVTIASSERMKDARSLKELGMKIETEDFIGKLEKYRDASWWERARLRMDNELAADHGFQVQWDDKVLEKKIESYWGGFSGEKPIEATRTINERDEVVYTEERPGTALDLAALKKSVKALQPTSLSEGAVGGSKLLSRSLPLPIVETVPNVTLAKLKEEGIERKIAEFTTSFTSSAAGRSYNVTAAAKALNDTLLMPGDVFQYGDIVSKAEKEYGWKEAPVIVKGKLTPGIGGGICQVSSTLYNAILEAGLDVVERRNHSLVVHYLPPGLDATFADGYVNFRFRNSTGKQLLIRTVVEDKRLTVKLFGTMPDNVVYRTETEQIKVVAPKVTYVANSKLALGSSDTLQKGEPGYVVDTYRLKYVDGKLVERKKLNRSTYKAQAELVAVNPADPLLHPEGGAAPSPAPAPADEGPVEPV
ncbi:VanW family protein [Cohnella faecalis]|uniref:VanW family protein n=1 Tax=Cohnella faecalis TaxID=2315694 RepID=UPI003616929B